MMIRDRVVAVVATSALVLLSGCGSDAETATEPKATDTPSASVSATPAEPSGDALPDLTEEELASYVDSAERQLQDSMGTFNGVYSEIRIEPVYPTGIEYIYVYSKPVDVDEATTGLDGYAPTLQTLFDTQIVPELKSIGITEPKATWTYLNPDKSLVWTRSFTES